MKVRKNLFPTSLFAIYLGILLLMSGIHTGLIVAMNSFHWGKLAQTVVPMIYWGIVAVGLTLFTRQKIKSTYTVLRLKRNRKIINKAELTRLERNFEACVNEIDRLERAKTSAATTYALILGIIGTAFMAGATFAVTAQPPRYILCIILAVPGFLGWIFPYLLYKKIAGEQTEKMAVLIEEKYDQIYEICEKGNKLLY